MESTSGRLLWIATGAGVLSGLILGALVAVGVMQWGGGAAEAPAMADMGGGPPAAQVRVGVARVEKLRHRIPVVGRLQEVRRVTVTSEVAGKIIEMGVDAGTEVQGDETMIARVDDVWALLRLKSAEADVAAAESEVAQSRSDLQQLEQLQQAGSAKAKEVEDKRTLMAGNLARLSAATAARDLAQQESQRSRIVAPFGGTVSQKLVEVGQWVEPGDGVVEMVSAGEIDAVIDLPERYVNALSVGDEVEVVVDAAGQRIVGKIQSIRPDGMNASRTFPVKVRLPDQDGQLRAGMSVTANLPVVKEADVVTVPRDAVLFSPGGAAVWYALDPSAMGGAGDAVSDGGGGGGVMAMSEPVRVLFGVDDRYAVEPLPGAPFPALQDGTQVVIEGAERLFPTQPLQLVNAEEAKADETSASSPQAPEPTTPAQGGM